MRIATFLRIEQKTLIFADVCSSRGSRWWGLKWPEGYFPSSHPHKGFYFSLMLWHKRPRRTKSLCSPAERSRGDTRVAGCSSQGGGYPLLQSFPRPEPGAPHTADHNHTQDILLQTLSQNGNGSVMEHWIWLTFFKTLGGVGSALWPGQPFWEFLIIFSYCTSTIVVPHIFLFTPFLIVFVEFSSI